MQTQLSLTGLIGAVALLYGATSVPHAAFAKAARTWVDPPAKLDAPVQPPTAPAPAQIPAAEAVPAAPAQQEAKPQSPVPERQPDAAPAVRTAEPSTRREDAKTFVMNYLETWSSPNSRALDATAELYAPRVLYHGRTIALERVFKQKQRFAQRWPERDYRPREDAIGSECNPEGTVCKVHTVFDYVAANPRRGRFSQGSGALQLIVEFIGNKPIIVAEHSTVITQSRKRKLASEDVSDE
ncbi:hypothetical protein AB4Y85_08015 [Microvirga sp. 2YAF29]|uniref:hypothetical protein n=1 Tax=Microvirga sp. 2YAF29 TaxID=3233031 RepID=UPI003F964174